jgi:hypothetical protein
MSDAPQREMPKYTSHKTVWALEIDRVVGTLELHFRDPGYGPIRVPGPVVSRYAPEPGDFYVVYADGYQSISPRKAFLEGYTKIEG